MSFDAVKARATLLQEFPKRRILVVGDLILDRYIRGATSRVSEEAPVLIVRVAHKESVLGAAANVARNLASLDVGVDLAGFIGNDTEGDQLLELCDQCGIGRSAIVKSKAEPTTVKTRILAAEKQLLRIDEEQSGPRHEEDEAALIEALVARLDQVGYDAVIVSDYAKGVCTLRLCQAVIQASHGKGLPVFVDPKGGNWERYRGATSIKPNQLEMFEISREMGWPAEDPIEAAKRLREHLALQFVTLTLGPRGIALVEEERTTLLAVEAKEVFDVSGAGDTVIATMSAGLASGLDLIDATTLANVAAGYVVSKMGTTAVTKEELLSALQGRTDSTAMRKFYTLDQLVVLIHAWREHGLSIAFTNGCFDVIHAGHVQLLEGAAATADRLIVGVNTDESVRGLKGPNRPYTAINRRAMVLTAFESVDAVVAFEEETPLDLIQTIRPDVLVKGGDYEEDAIVGGTFVKSYGGEVKRVPIVEGLSSTKLISSLRQSS